jgi:hypothetical protein
MKPVFSGSQGRRLTMAREIATPAEPVDRSGSR